jgi:two-component system, sensor histidine kinase and response regulator
VKTELSVPILIVDDNAAKRLALKAVLAPLRHSIVEADSGQVALRRVMSQDFAVILLDVRMPGMDGFETASLIRQRRQSETTPIIFITAYANDEIEQSDRYVEGAVDFMFAPVQPDELRAKVSVFAKLFIKAEGLAIRARGVQTTADQLRLLTEAAPIGIFQTDEQNRYVYTNPRWTEITGIPAEAAIGQNWATIIGSGEGDGLVAELVAQSADAGELSHRFDIRPPDSPARIVLATSKAIPDTNGGIAGWVGTLADVTAEAGAEEAMLDARDKATEASGLKSDFLANMSHEIRTPMNGVIGMTDLLLETELDATQRDYAQTVRNSGEALLSIISDILDFSKVEAGKLEIEDIQFNLQSVVDGVMDLLSGPAQTKGLELASVVESSVPAVVSGDPGRVRQVLTNFVGNAIKFTDSGEIVVRVTKADAAGGETLLHFEISDTGIGVAPDKLGLIFQPFVQADTSTTRRYGGTGLGLAISGQLVALMGGECGVTSHVGEGSRFWFTICVHANADEAAAGRPMPDPGLMGVRALIVERNAMQRGVLTEYLTAWGMVVSTADSGPSALTTLKSSALRGEPIPVALVDRSIVGIDGLELKNVIVGDPALSTRLVLIPGLGQGRYLGDAAESEICASLSRPVHREDLRTCLRVVLGLDVPEEADRKAAAGPSETHAGRLLLAEDNLINQKVAVAMLSRAGYRVDAVLDGAAAVEAAASEPYDAILMDCQMPELNGYEATAAIRAREGSDRHTPIIALTAGARPEDRERCLAEGMDSYLSKPVSKEALLALVASSVKAQR